MLDLRHAHNIYAADRSRETVGPIFVLLGSVMIAPIAGSVIGIIGGVAGGIGSRHISQRFPNQKNDDRFGWSDEYWEDS